MAPTDTTPAAPAPPLLAQYRKAAVAAGVGLLAFLTDLATSYASGNRIDGGEWLHAGILLVSTVLTTGGVTVAENAYPRAELLRRLGVRPVPGRG
jgi:hypothetical protein